MQTFGEDGQPEAGAVSDAEASSPDAADEELVDRTEPATSPDKKEWSISGAVSIGECELLKQEFIESLQSFKEICLDLSEITSVDLAFLQLLVAAIRSAREKDISLYCQGAIPEALLTLAERTGINDIRNDSLFRGFFSQLTRVTVVQGTESGGSKHLCLIKIR